MEEDSRLPYFLLGLGIGVAAGVLFAPKSGAETREYLRTKATDSADYVKRRSLDIRDTATQAIERGKESLQRQRESLTAAVEAGKSAYREAQSAPMAD